MNGKKIKGIILAAGFGSRLRPLTNFWPKPLIPFLGSSPLHLALNRFKAAGIKDVAVNTHYLADQIAKSLVDNPFDLRTVISYEPEILGTGGVYNPLRKWMDSSDILVMNGDIVSDVDLSALLEMHERTSAVATMALLPNVLPGEAAVYFRNDEILAIGRSGPNDASRGNFGCVQILTKEFLELLPTSGSFDIISQGYQIALANRLKVSALVHHGIWYDIGTINRYASSIFDIIGRPGGLEAIGGDQKGFIVTSDGSVIENGASIEDSSQIEHSIVLRGGLVCAGDHIRNMIIAPNARVSFDSPD